MIPAIVLSPPKIARPLIMLVAAFLTLLLTVSPTFAQRKTPRSKSNTSVKQPTQPTTPEPAPQPTPPPAPPTIKLPETPLAVEVMEKMYAVIETSMGDITLEFYPKSAPNHVRQFIWLAQNNYFDGMSFSRVIPKAIIQSGNPASWVEGNANQQKRFEINKLKAEYDANLKHERGILSMARPNDDPDGGTSHFFICTLKFSSLDGKYSIFGHVVNGFEVMDAIAAVPLEEGTADKPKDRIDIKRVTIKEKIDSGKEKNDSSKEKSDSSKEQTGPTKEQGGTASSPSN